MNIQELNQKLEEVEKESKNAERQEEFMKILREYHGEDEIIVSSKVQKILAERKEDRTRFFTGIPSLDKIIDGFEKEDLTIVTAPTGQGKTTFCQSLTKNFAQKEIKCLWFSYEGSQYNFLEKFGQELPEFYLPKKLVRSDISWIEKKILEGIAKYDTRIVFIDHLHFLFDLAGINTNMSLWIGGIMRELKRIAIEYKVSIFLVAHLTKVKFEERPGLSDIRDSSFITQEADNVLVMWRATEIPQSKEAKKEKGIIFTNQAIVSVEKNRRTGQLGTFKLIMKDNLFQELEEKYE